MNLQENILRIKEMMGIISETTKMVNKIEWVKPEFQTEENEFMNHFLNWLQDDVIQVNFNDFSKKQLNKLIDDIHSAYEKADVEPLTDKEWSKMENTDSWTIETYKDLFDIIHGQWGRSEERIIKHSMLSLIHI